jgi:quercetin dioxygenase-like cupin family protein
MDPLNYAILYTGSDAKTHFKDDYIPWQPTSGSATESPHVTPFQEATDIGFLRLPVGLRSHWHPAPRKQFVMVLTGIMEVETEDGQKRTFTPGSVLLVMDVDGKGHRTNVLGEQEVFVVWVPIP